jgi:hypothetical protein
LAQDNRDAARTFLIVTSAGGLVYSLGEARAGEAFECIDRIADLKRAGGLEVHVYVPDDASRSTGEFPALEGGLGAEALAEALDAVEQAVCPGRHIDYVLLVGGGDVIPFHYLENPAADSDGDFPSDSPYAVAGGGGDFLLPDRALARLPLGAGPRMGLVGYLEALASGDYEGAIRDRRFGLSALEWKTESTKVYGVLGGDDLMTSPPVDASGFKPAWLETRALVYFNVHGSRTERYWYGQDGMAYPRVLSPEIVASADPAGAIVLSEACYGGLVADRSPADSVAMAFLMRGTAAFVGSSAIAYGSPDENLTEADLLAHFFFSRLAGGETAGVALREAKIDFAAEMLDRQGYLDGDDRKTLLEFSLFGDPTVGIYKCRGKEDRSGDMVSKDVLADIMKLAGDRFPEMKGVEPDVSEQTGGSGEELARKVTMLRPASKIKGVPRPEGRVFVASFRQTITVEGRDIERVVRITFHESGRVIKVVTSK